MQGRRLTTKENHDTLNIMLYVHGDIIIVKCYRDTLSDICLIHISVIQR